MLLSKHAAVFSEPEAEDYLGIRRTLSARACADSSCWPSIFDRTGCRYPPRCERAQKKLLRLGALGPSGRCSPGCSACPSHHTLKDLHIYRVPRHGARSASMLFVEEFCTPRPKPLRPLPERMNMLVSSIGRLATLRQNRSHLLS